MRPELEGVKKHLDDLVGGRRLSGESDGEARRGWKGDRKSACC